MFNWLDGLLLLLLIAACARGFRRGAIEEVGGLVAYIVGVLVADAYSPVVGGYFAQAFPGAVDHLTVWLVGSTASSGNAAANPFIDSPLAQVFSLDLPTGPHFGEWLAQGFLTVIAFAVVFLVAVFAVRLASSLLSSFFNLTPLGIVNRSLGFLAGGAVGALFLGVILSLIVFFVKLGGWGASLQGSLDHSVLAPILMQVFAWSAIQFKLILATP